MRSDDDPPSNSMKRLPLTSIPVDGPFPSDDDAKSNVSTPFVFGSSAHSDDELRPSLYHRRKSSVPALTLVGKVPYTRRRSHHRRASPPRNSPSMPVSLTPIPTSFNTQRRTSLPALHFLETVQNEMPLHIGSRSPSRRGSISEDIYGSLQSFSFGTPPRPVRHDNEESDDDERLRRDRAKMRAIDDGTRRPSLPPNDSADPPSTSRHSFSSMTSSVAPSVGSSAHIVVGECQWDGHGEPDWDIVMGDITPTKTSPPLATPSTVNTTESAGLPTSLRRPSLPIPVPSLRRRSRSAEELSTEFDRKRSMTPTQLSTSSPLFPWAESHSPGETRESSPEENALDGFDLDFILSQPAAAEEDRGLRRQASPSRLRSKFRTKTTNTPPRVEDTFTGHLDQYDPVYERRKREWSFRRVIRPPVASQKVKSKDDALHVPCERERWRSEYIGEFTVVKTADPKPPHPIDSPKPFFNRLMLRHLQDPYNRGNRDGGPHVVIHRHKRAHAYSIVRAFDLPSSERTKENTEFILMGCKAVLREYTRTESTRALNTHGLIDDDDSRSSHRHHHRELRSNTGSQSQSEAPRSKTKPSGTAVHDSNVKAPDVKRSSPLGFSRSSQPSSSHPPEIRSRKDSNRTITTPSPSTPKSMSSSRPSSFGNSKPMVIIEPSTPVTHWDITTSTSPRTSTSHAEAFAMRGLDTRGLETHHHHRDVILTNVDVPPRNAAPLPPPAPSMPHQQKGFGFSERFRRAFGSKQQHQGKDVKEPVSPGTEDEDEPKTATLDYAPPWITVVRRGEKEQQEYMIRTLNTSFESVGLIPPQDSKKKPSKPRPKAKECAVFEDIPEDSMCMLLPLWPGETLSSRSHSHSQSLSRHRSSRRGESLSTTPQSRASTIPLQERKFLLVYYTPFVQSPMDHGSHGSGNNKKRRRPQTAGDRPQHDQRNVTTAGGTNSFRVVARLLSYDDVRSSGVRLPEKGLSVAGSLKTATLAIPSPSIPCFNSQVIAQCHGPEDGVELVQEGLEQLGLMDHTAPRGVDVNGDPTGVRLSVLGRAVVEMVWSGCMSLMMFP